MSIVPCVVCEGLCYYLTYINHIAIHWFHYKNDNCSQVATLSFASSSASDVPRVISVIDMVYTGCAVEADIADREKRAPHLHWSERAPP